MTDRERARPTTRQVRGRRTAAGLLLAVAATVAAVGYQTTASPTSNAARATRTSPSTTAASPSAPSAPKRTPPIAVLGSNHRDGLGEADGAVPAGTTVFDGQVPGVANLDRSLLRALRRAATDAADDGVEFVVDSGWRSRAYQQHLLDEATVKYGSEEEAARWVATPTTSAHVSGDAVDIGPAGADAWLSVHGAEYGLCQIYHNEPWHYELRPGATDSGCPALYKDPTHDPRMKQR